ncbi:ABC transporter permease subunit [Undibacter mobilis]|uniref:ABC transporter permease subunit n=2 Tax=Undibacter mobilis TaxID=2292256 RepID=A0A371B125_9BRAD|nr:ABC transporter permease subunit [Undibacter mobilis]
MRRGYQLMLALPGAAVFVLFFLIPLIVVSADGFTGGGAAFLRVLRNELFWGGLRGSLILGATASVFSLVVGFVVALHLSRLSERARTLMMFFIALPLTFSGLIVAYGFILSYGRAGFITQILSYAGVDPVAFSRLLFSPQGLAFAASYYLIPRVVMLMLPVLVNFDRAQFAAAESLGATRAQVIWQILVPQIMPTAVSAFCLIAAVAVGAYGTALALVGTQVNILPLQLYSMISESGSDFPAAAALSLILMAICSCIIAVGEIAAARHERQDVVR